MATACHISSVAASVPNFSANDVPLLHLSPSPVNSHSHHVQVLDFLALDLPSYDRDRVLSSSCFLLLAAIVSVCHESNAQMMFAAPGMGGSMGCVVTGNQLYSHGHYIRDLNNTEIDQVQKYREEMIVFQKKFDEALKNAFRTSQNVTVPTLPLRPTVPEFCFAKDTVLYVFAGCTVQNYKLYIGQNLVRELTSEEQMELDKFAKQMAAMPRPSLQDPSMGSEMMTPPTTITPPSVPPSLNFCTEL